MIGSLPLNQQKLANSVDAFYSLYPENHEKKCYLFSDEIQIINRWQLVVISTFDDSKNAEIFLTGSSAKLLSKEIATSLRGQSLAIEIWPYCLMSLLGLKNLYRFESIRSEKPRINYKQLFHQYLSVMGDFRKLFR